MYVRPADASEEEEEEEEEDEEMPDSSVAAHAAASATPSGHVNKGHWSVLALSLYHRCYLIAAISSVCFSLLFTLDRADFEQLSVPRPRQFSF